MPATDRIDARFGLPDAVLPTTEAERHHMNAGLLRVAGLGCFARCLLPVQLSGGLELVLGTWMQIPDADGERALAVWDEPGYADLVFTGTLANAIEPWGEELLHAPLTATVRNADEIPYVQAGEHPLLSQVLHTVWDRDHVLRCFGHPLPVPVRTPLNEQWSIERSPGMAARVVNGTSQFASPGRTVHADLLTAPHQGTPAELLTSLTEGAPSVDAAHRITEEHRGALRHAFWLESTSQGRTQHELYGFVIQGDHAVALACMYDDPSDLAWAQHVWRSINHSAR
ncbi:DUF2199 domain-containing protein [Streptomyces sp. NPDC013178]|uniref:DUF2199 domain-containing protein n=1 Tax=Streptomyces sp. NPDC013178 TaxID=3155118 RepID=UPI0033FBCB43